MPDDQMIEENQPKRVCHFDFDGTVDLEESDIWPDGDAPKDWTAADVAAVIKQCGGRLSVIRDWDLDDYLVLTVTADDHTQERL